MSDLEDFNRTIIDEFRASGGEVGGPFAGVPLLLLHHRGARTGTPRVSPLTYRKLDGGWAVFATKAGSSTNPAWFHNLVAHPDAEVEIGPDRIEVTARVAEGDERDAIWEAQKGDVPQFVEYEARTSRVIPVIVLEPR